MRRPGDILSEKNVPCKLSGAIWHGNHPVDLVWVSSTGDSFGSHRQFLERFSNYSGEFGEDDCGTKRVNESSAVVELIVEFLHPSPPPECSGLDFEVLMELARAAETYGIFAAITVCKLQLKRHARLHAADIFAHAIRYSYFDLADEIVAHTVNLKGEEILRALDIAGPSKFHAFAAWNLYREEHTLRDVYRLYRKLSAEAGPSYKAHKTTRNAQCATWSLFRDAVKSMTVTQKVATILDFDTAVDLAWARLDPPCPKCEESSAEWRAEVVACLVAAGTFSQTLAKLRAKESNT